MQQQKLESCCHDCSFFAELQQYGTRKGGCYCLNKFSHKYICDCKSDLSEEYVWLTQLSSLVWKTSL